ncbi:MAG: glycerophosphodiester phosphodiesterase [Opitutaceae bacterium]|nr:glycerophosphodiester phosphodiesterase [Opitutaceae bacterium]
MNQPQVIAHRGASGYLPENSLAAMTLAHRQAADWLEIDVVLTRDDEVLVLHDLELDCVTDAAARYPGRARADGRWHALDFTLAEIRPLRSMVRRDPRTGKPAYAGRFPAAPEPQPLATLDELVRHVQTLNQAAGREVGLCVELKRPLYHDRIGRDLTAATVDILRRHGLATAGARCMLLSFEPTVLRRARHELGWEASMLQLTGPAEWGEDNMDYPALLTAAGVREIATYADWLGPHLQQVFSWGTDGTPRPTGLAATAQAAGLRVAPYTFQHEGLPTGVTLAGLVEYALGPLRLDGAVCDFPDVAVVARERLAGA